MAQYDDVRGLIIGGEYVGWALFYDQRPQGQKHYADTEAQALDTARAEIARLECEYKLIGLYANRSLWEIRIY